jgi:serine/threonine-protein kinase
VKGGAELPQAVGAHPKRMLDRYEILAEIAHGGMGTVYLSRLGGAGGFERLFAIKLMHDHLAEDETFVTMLLDEARTAAHIHHPNAVGIIDVRESPVGYYLVMNYVDGFALSQILEHQGLDPNTRIRISTRLLADAAHGLHAAHSAKNPQGQHLGIVHRDVSPQNILVGTDGVGRIVDFGIALAASRITSSRPGMLKGKPSYMAPEQARGEPCHPRSDVFALGIVFWEVLTGERLFDSEMDLATLVKVTECVVEPPSKHAPYLHPGLCAVSMKALQKDQADRYATAREFAVAIERAAESAGMLATAHEVEEVLARLFANEIATRQEAIRARLSYSMGKEEPLDRLGLAAISRLVPRKRDGSSVDHGSSAPATRTSRPAPSQSSGVRESAEPRMPVALVMQSGEGAAFEMPRSSRHANPAMQSSEGPSQRERTTGRSWLAAVIAVLILMLGAATILVYGNQHSEEATSGPVAPPLVVPPPAELVPPPAPAPSTPLEPSPTPPEDIPSEAVPHGIEPTAVRTDEGVQAEPRTSERSDSETQRPLRDSASAARDSHREHESRARTEQALPTNTEASAPSPPASSPEPARERTRTPVVESNPYLTH